jgi:hypothetical protein
VGLCAHAAGQHAKSHTKDYQQACRISSGNITFAVKYGQQQNIMFDHA